MHHNKKSVVQVLSPSFRFFCTIVSCLNDFFNSDLLSQELCDKSQVCLWTDPPSPTPGAVRPTPFPTPRSSALTSSAVDTVTLAVAVIGALLVAVALCMVMVFMWQRKRDDSRGLEFSPMLTAEQTRTLAISREKKDSFNEAIVYDRFIPLPGDNKKEESVLIGGAH